MIARRNPQDIDRLPLDNPHVADRLEQVADMLEAQDANLFRTARSGPLRGRRVVRGREEECAEYYARQSTEAAAHV